MVIRERKREKGRKHGKLTLSKLSMELEDNVCKTIVQDKLLFDCLGFPLCESFLEKEINASFVGL